MVFFSRFMVGSCTVEDFTAVRSMGVDMKLMLRCGAVSLVVVSVPCVVLVWHTRDRAYWLDSILCQNVSVEVDWCLLEVQLFGV